MNLVLVLVGHRIVAGDTAGGTLPYFIGTNTLAKLIKGINHDYWVGGQTAKAKQHAMHGFDLHTKSGRSCGVQPREPCELHMQ